jgi:hypothetical protein
MVAPAHLERLFVAVELDGCDLPRSDAASLKGVQNTPLPTQDSSQRSSGRFGGSRDIALASGSGMNTLQSSGDVRVVSIMWRLRSGRMGAVLS